MYVVFKNKGLIDLRAVTTFGVSAKAGSNPIGFFGTGLKYAIAILLREGGQIILCRGKGLFEFKVSKHEIRDKEFSIVSMNDLDLSFTTELGKGWELWQAFRELYCNALDENGTVELSEEFPELDGEGTTIVVRHGPFVEQFYARGEIVLQSKPIHTVASGEVHAGRSDYAYYRGIRAHKLSKPSLFTYNVTRPCTLTEDRTLKYSFEANEAIADMVGGMVNKADIHKALTWGGFESVLEFESWGGTPSQPFLDVCSELRKDHSEHVNRSAVRYARKHLALQEPAAHACELTPVQQRQLDRAIEFVKQLGYPVDEFPIIPVDSLGEDILGLAENRCILLSIRVFDMGTKMVAGTLVEEFIHLEYKHTDCSRGMQNYLIDRLMTMGENLLGEPI